MRARAGIVVVIVTGLAAAAAAPARRGAEPVDAATLVAQLQATTAPWTAGDLEAFIAPYDANSSYMTKDGPVGRDAMRDRYRKTYFGPNGEKPRPLRFEQIEVRALGDDHALMTGRFVLGGDGTPDQTGWFTLVWLRTAAGWRILHDHSS
jgi:ketosteroid isomerase-like protein